MARENRWLCLVGAFLVSLFGLAFYVVFMYQPQVNAQTNSQNISSTHYFPVAFHDYKTPQWDYVGLTGKVSDIHLDPTNSEHMYVSVYLDGLYETQDRGISWVRHEQFTLTTRINDIEANPLEPNTLYLATWAGYALYWSEDGRVPWNPIAGWTELNPTLYSMAIHPMSPTVMFAGSGTWEPYGGAIYKSINGGDTWYAVSPDFTNALTFAFHPISPTVIYAGAIAGVWRSQDSGETWTSVNSGFDDEVDYASSLLIHPEQTEWLYVATSQGIYVSYNNADSWQQLWEEWDTNTLHFHPDNPNILYAGTENGIYISHNTGESWSQLGSCGTNMPINILVIDPAETRTLWAGTGDRISDGYGLWRCVIS